MRKITLALTSILALALSAGAAWRPGLHCGYHLNGGRDFTTEPIWTGTTLDPTATTNRCNSQVVSTSPIVTNGTSTGVWSQKRCWYYWGQIFLPAGEIEFGAAIDDYLQLQIDGAVVLEPPSCKLGTVTLSFEKAGWHDFTLKVGDVGGAAGPIEGGRGIVDGLGFAIRENGSSDWSYPADDGKMSRYRYDDGLGFEDLLTITGSPLDLGEVTPPYGPHAQLAPGASFPCSVSAVTTTKNGIDYRYAGYEIHDIPFREGEVKALVSSGSETTFTYLHGDTQRELTWKWEATGYHVQGESLDSNQGTVTGSGLYAPGEVARLEAHPAPGYGFWRWTGDIPSRLTRTPALTFTDRAVLHATAHFAPAFYVGPDGDDSADGRTPETALLSLSHAVAQIQGESIVYILPGTNLVDGTVTVSKPLSIVGLEGAEKTILLRTSTEKTDLLRLEHAEATIEGVTIDGNNLARGRISLTLAGGAWCERCVIRNTDTHSISGHGAGVRIEGDGYLADCVISNNLARSSGGAGSYGAGLWMEGGLVERCRIVRNKSGTGNASRGGGLYITGGTIRNSLIAKNSSTGSGSGVYIWNNADLPCTIENCTIVDNFFDTERGDSSICNGVLLAAYGKAPVTIRNCIIDGNLNTTGENNLDVIARGRTSFEHTCLVPLEPGTGNIAIHPHFADRVAEDYRLASGPCIDGGLSADWMTDDVDLDGERRLLGETVDLGCLEHRPGPLTCSFSSSRSTGIDSLSVSFEGYVSAENHADLTYRWDFGDGSPVMDGPGLASVSHLYPVGIFTVTLTVSNGEEEATYRVPRCVNVAPSTIYVVTNNPSARFPYSTWETAATNLHEAVANCVDGGTIVVSNGLYTLNGTLRLSRKTDFRSVNGAEATLVTIDRPESILYLSNPDARVSGFTFFGARRSAVVIADGGGGTLENCILRDNKTDNNTTWGAGVSANGEHAVVRNCKVYNNQVTCSGGWGGTGAGIDAHMGAFVEGCLVSNNVIQTGIPKGAGIYNHRSTVLNCVIVDNRVLSASDDGRHDSRGGGLACYGGVTRNCLIAGNLSTHEAAGAFLEEGTIENCTIVSNRCIGTRKTGEFSSGLTLKGGAKASNVIVWDNFFADGTEIEVSTLGTKSGIETSVFRPLEGVLGEGNRAEAPFFLNPLKRDYRLRMNSPCIDTGRTLPWMEGTLDLAGEPRVIGPSVDIGCFEKKISRAMLLQIR